MSKVTRFSVSLEDELLQTFDELLQREGYPTRSEAVKALIRQAIIDKSWQSEGEVAATITLVYDHHKSNLSNRLIHIQHDFGAGVIASQHIHLDHDNCLEVLIVRGPVSEIQLLTTKLKSVKGIKHCELSMTTTGSQLA